MNNINTSGINTVEFRIAVVLMALAILLVGVFIGMLWQKPAECVAVSSHRTPYEEFAGPLGSIGTGPVEFSNPVEIVCN